MSRGRGDQGENVLYGAIGPRGDKPKTQFFTRPTVDTISVDPIEGTDDFLLFEFSPAGGNKNTRSGFITVEDKKKLEVSDDPIATYLEVPDYDGYDQHRRDGITVYGVLTERGRSYLEDTVFESDGYAEMFEDARTSLEMGTLDVDQLITFDGYDHTFWRPGAEAPISRPQSLELWGQYFRPDEAKKLLEDNPAVLSVEIADVPYYNREIAGEQNVIAVVKFPQEQYDQMWRWAKEEGEDSTHLDERMLVMHSAMDADEDGAYRDGLEKYGLTDILGLSSAVRSEEERKRLQYSEDNNW